MAQHVYNSSCVWQTVTMRTAFVTQVAINGTGFSINYGLLKYDTGRCNSNRPSGSTSSNSFWMIPSVTGQCGTVLVGEDSVATQPGPQDLGSKFNCGDNME